MNEGLAFEKHAVDILNDNRFLGHDLRQPIGAFAVTEELLVGEGDLAKPKRYRIERDAHAGAPI